MLRSEAVLPAATGLRRNRLLRIGFFFVGLLLFYAPFAFFVQLLAPVFPGTSAANSVADVHTVCLRMPITWLVQPWLWSTMLGNPVYLFAVIVLPLAAVFGGPLFCGWVCPAGGITEHLGRIVPDRFKYDVHGKVPLAPVRYGFFVGLLLAPFVATGICCSFCNFTPMQNFLSAATGDFRGFLYFSTMSVFTMFVWLIPMGLFTKGGRGWCNFLCPVGAWSNLASTATGRLPFAVRVRHDASKCSGCGGCEDLCPPRAVTVRPEKEVDVSPYICNACLDCVKACPTGALRYGRPE